MLFIRRLTNVILRTVNIVSIMVNVVSSILADVVSMMVNVSRLLMQKEEKAQLLMRLDLAKCSFIQSLEARVEQSLEAGSLEAVAQQGAKRKDQPD